MKKSLHLNKIAICILFAFGLIFTKATQAQMTVTIGDPASTSYSYQIPINNLWGYTYSQQILYSSEIGMSGNISKVRFKYNTGSLVNNDNWKVFLGYTTATTFTSGTSWVPLSALTEIFTGTVTASGGWIEITLATPFLYNMSSGNLVVAVDENSASYTYTSNMFPENSSTVNRSIYYRSDGTNPDPASPPSGTLYNKYNTIQLDITPNLACDTITMDAGIISTPIEVCPSTAFSVVSADATSAIGITYTWQSRPGTGGAWTTIPGATSSILSSTGISASTEFRLIVTCTATGNSDTSAGHTVLLKPIAECLCIPVYTTGCSWDDDIDDFIFYGETMDIINLNTPCPAGSYINYTSMMADVLPGESYTGSISTNYTSAYENYRIWIDFNENGIFESSESVAFGGPFSSAAPSNFTINIPATAIPGTKIMRVRLIYSGTASTIDPCSSYGYGETHDYSIQIISPCPKPATFTATTPSSTSASITFTNTTPPVGTMIEYGPAGFTPGTGTTVYPATSPQLITGLIPNTYYDYYVRNICGPTDTSMLDAGASFATPCQIPTVVSTVNDSVCNEGFGVLEAYASPNATITWYEDLTACCPLTDGTTFTTPVHTSTTNYYVEASIGDAGPCVSTKVAVTLQVNPTPSLTLVPEIDTVCLGSYATFTASSDVAVKYLWSTGDTTAAMSTNIPGLHEIVITDNVGCENTGTVLLDTFTDISVEGFDYIAHIFSDPYSYRFTPISPVAVTNYYWIFGDGSTSNEMTPEHTYSAFGTYDVTLIVSNDCTADTVYLQIHVKPENTSANDLDADKIVTVYPNPAKQLLYINTVNAGTMIKSVRVYNTTAQFVQAFNNINNTQTNINVGSLPSGTYHLIIESSNGERIHKKITKLD